MTAGSRRAAEKDGEERMTELYADTLPELLAPRGFAPAPPVERAV